jgi:hypothetical protein
LTIHQQKKNGINISIPYRQLAISIQKDKKKYSAVLARQNIARRNQKRKLIIHFQLE